MAKYILNPQEVESQLRPYQLQGVKEMNDYIQAFDPKKAKLSALVAMPTGSGKTVIIAALACCLSRNKCVLVLSPRRPVVDQLFTELSGNLFNNKFKGLKNKPSKPVCEEKIDESNVENGSVICWTIQRLHKAYKEEKELFKSLLQHVNLILFDEGHYEPALQWSKAVRSFQVPRVIFTATPFRNDFKSFDIDWQNQMYRISYSNLLEQNYLRKVEISNIGKMDRIETAVKDAIDRFKEIKDKNKSARLIIKCDSSEAIIAISKYLKKTSHKFIAIHETFNTSFRDNNQNLKNYLHQTVPTNQGKLDIDIWVHQYKLIEGIDSDKFRCLAIIDEMSNTRALVQQIGRIIRNPKKKPDTAYVYNYTEEDYEESWNGFVELDKNGTIAQTLPEQIFEGISKTLSDYQYIDKKVRNKLTSAKFRNWTEEQLKENLQLPLKANFIDKYKSFKYDYFIEEYLEKYFEGKNHIFYKNIYEEKSGLYLYFNIHNSPFLRNTFFPEINHHICFFKEETNFLIFYDSDNLLPLGREDLGLGYGVAPKFLRAIFKQTTDTVVTRVALKSSNIGSIEPHSHSFIASSIEKTAPNLNDFSHFLSSAFGHYTDKKVYKDYKNKELKDKEFQIPTYIGIGAGRVSQNEGTYVKFKEYLDWIKYICNSLEEASNSSNVFKRYTTEISNKKDPIPECILLDIFDFENTHKIIVDNPNEILNESENDEESQLSLTFETFYIIHKTPKANEYSFKLKINKKEYPVKILFDQKRNRYLLESDEISGEVTSEVSSENQKVASLMKAINRKQCFRILTKNGLSYSGGRFYKPHFKFGKEFDNNLSPLAKMLFPIKELDKRFSEKGTKNGSGQDEWENKSIFDLIAKRGLNTDLKNYFIEYPVEKEELLICTDLGTEPADFIFVSNRKLVFIHVKGKGNIKKKVKKSLYGAKPISEICNQAVKNAHHLSIFDNSIPKNIKEWSQEWKLKDAYIVKNRIRTKILPTEVNKTDSMSIWNYISKKKMDVNISKEIWLVLGYTFSKDRFIKAISQNKPVAEAKQAALTLESTLATVHSLGIKLKVFCS